MESVIINISILIYLVLKEDLRMISIYHLFSDLVKEL